MRPRSKSAAWGLASYFANSHERLNRRVGNGFDVVSAVAVRVGDGDLGGCFAARGCGSGEFGLQRGEVGLGGLEVLPLAGDGFRELAFPFGEGRDASVELA